MTTEVKVKGVEWEMVTRFPWDGQAAIELRAFSRTEVEVKVTATNACGAATGQRVIALHDLRQALDALEVSARSIERL